MAEIVQKLSSDKDTQLKFAALGIGGVAVAALSAALMFSGRKEIVDVDSAQAGATTPVEKANPGDNPAEMLAAPPFDRTPVEPESAQSDQALAPVSTDPCLGPNAAELAAQSFSDARRWLDCDNAHVQQLAAGFVQDLLGEPAAAIPEELKTALLEAVTDKFSQSKLAVLAELGNLSARAPDAFVENKNLPVDYQGTRFDVLEDRYGRRKPMIVVFSGSQGQAYSIPNSPAGQQFALDKIMMERADGGEVDSAWYELLLEQGQNK